MERKLTSSPDALIPDSALHKKCPLTMLFMGKIGLFGLEKLSE